MGFHARPSAVSSLGHVYMLACVSVAAASIARADSPLQPPSHLVLSAAAADDMPTQLALSPILPSWRLCAFEGGEPCDPLTDPAPPEALLPPSHARLLVLGRGLHSASFPSPASSC